MRRISFWLLPDQETAAFLANQIQLLSQQAGMPAFAPHLTLLSPWEASRESLLERMDSFSPIQDQDVVWVDSRGISHSEAFYRAVVIETSLSPGLSQLRQQLGAHLHWNAPTPYLPHVSLVYGHFDSKKRDELMAMAEFPSRIQFNRIRAISPGPQSKGREDYPGWEVLGEWDL